MPAKQAEELSLQYLQLPENMKTNIIKISRSSSNRANLNSIDTIHPDDIIIELLISRTTGLDYYNLKLLPMIRSIELCQKLHRKLSLCAGYSYVNLTQVSVTGEEGVLWDMCALCEYVLL